MKTLLISILFCVCVFFGRPSKAQESASSEKQKSSASPDKQWEYKCADQGDGYYVPQIVKIGTSEVVLIFVRDLNISSPLQAEVVWAPDSKRFAFNYSPPHGRHATYETVVFYELDGEKWTELTEQVAEDDKSIRNQLVRLAKEHLLKSAHRTGEELIPDILKVHSWTDANTAIAYSIWGERSKPEAALVLTLKFDSAGNWKITKSQRMSQKQIETQQ